MFSISKAKEKDVKEIQQVLKTTWIATYGKVFSSEAIDKITSVWHSEENILSTINNPNAYIAVTKTAEGKIVGMITAIKEDHILHLYRLYILPEFQKKGLGQELFSYALASFNEVTSVVLEVEEMNQNAIGFYKKLGFEQQGETEEEVEGVKLKAYKMVKQL